MSIITELAQQAKQAARTLAILSESQKNAVLTDMAAAIRANKDTIIAVNEKEVARAKENNLDAAMVDRLILNEERIESMAEGIEVIVNLDDPVGQERVIGTRPNGIEIKKNKSNYVQIELREYEGHKYVDVREFYDAEDGKRLPTKKGITFSPKVLEEVIDGLTMLNKQIDG